MPYDPEVDGRYADWLKDKGVQTRPGGWTNATHDQVLEDVPTRGDASGRKTVRDQLGHDVTQETTSDGRERRHVRINLP